MFPPNAAVEYYAKRHRERCFNRALDEITILYLVSLYLPDEIVLGLREDPVDRLR